MSDDLRRVWAAVVGLCLSVWLTRQAVAHTAERVRTNTIGMAFVLVPAGEFRMGSTAAEIDAYGPRWRSTK